MVLSRLQDSRCVWVRRPVGSAPVERLLGELPCELLIGDEAEIQSKRGRKQKTQRPQMMLQSLKPKPRNPYAR
jgi:hypothetical protein